jgi:hypothetical protein
VDSQRAQSVGKNRIKSTFDDFFLQMLQKLPLIRVPRLVAFLTWYSIVCVQLALFSIADRSNISAKDRQNAVQNIFFT